MGDKLDRMKAAASNPPAAVPRVTVPPRGKLVLPKGGSGVTPAKPPEVQFSCGHSRPFEVMKQRKCPKCIEEEFARRNQEASEARKRRDAKERLPAGASKVIVWDGTAWRGTLTVPGLEKTFSVESRTEVSCCRGLHRVYKAWLAANPHPPEAEPTGGSPG